MGFAAGISDTGNGDHGTCPSLKRMELLEELTVASVREFARANYDRGGDILEECLSDEEIEELIRKGQGEILLFLELQYSKRMDIESTVW